LNGLSALFPVGEIEAVGVENNLASRIDAVIEIRELIPLFDEGRELVFDFIAADVFDPDIVVIADEREA